jgi:hypothetical protein
METPRDPAHDPESTVSGGFIFGDEDSGKAERRAVPEDELIASLTALIQTCEGCENVKLIGVTRLDAPDTEGCNWSTSVVLDPAGVAAEVYSLAYAQVVFMARSSWNLK